MNIELAYRAGGVATGKAKVTPPAPTKPNKPYGLKAGTITADTIPFTWTKVGGATKYTVNAAPAVAGFPKDVTTEAASLTGLTTATEYTFTVKACNAVGCSADTSAKATTL